MVCKMSFEKLSARTKVVFRMASFLELAVKQWYLIRLLKSNLDKLFMAHLHWRGLYAKMPEILLRNIAFLTYLGN
jgi:hypothetical protein